MDHQPSKLLCASWTIGRKGLKTWLIAHKTLVAPNLWDMGVYSVVEQSSFIAAPVSEAISSGGICNTNGVVLVVNGDCRRGGGG